MSTAGETLVGVTVELAYAPVPYNGNGVTATFPTTWRFMKPEHLVVTKTHGGVDTELVLDVDYSVDGDGDPEPGGSITLLAGPLANGDTLTIERETPIVQLNAFRTLGQFSPETWERTVDWITLWGQENRYRLEALESLGNLVNVATLAAGVAIDIAIDPVLDPVTANFPVVKAVAGGLGATGLIPLRAQNEGQPLPEAVGVDWSPGPGANQITINGITGMTPGLPFGLHALVLF